MACGHGLGCLAQGAKRADGRCVFQHKKTRVSSGPRQIVTSVGCQVQGTVMPSFLCPRPLANSKSMSQYAEIVLFIGGQGAPRGSICARVFPMIAGFERPTYRRACAPFQSWTARAHRNKVVANAWTGLGQLPLSRMQRSREDKFFKACHRNESPSMGLFFLN